MYVCIVNVISITCNCSVIFNLTSWSQQQYALYITLIIYNFSIEESCRAADLSCCWQNWMLQVNVAFNVVVIHGPLQKEERKTIYNRGQTNESDDLSDACL